MKTTIIIHFMALTFSALLLQSCDYSANYQPKGNIITGNAIYVDTNFIKNGGHYAVAIYSNQNSPFSIHPVKTQNLEFPQSNPYYYRISWDGQGSFFVAIVWQSDIDSSKNPLVLGIFGCDTSHNCSSRKLIAFPNYTGADYKILYWADTAKKIY